MRRAPGLGPHLPDPGPRHPHPPFQPIDHHCQPGPGIFQHCEPGPANRPPLAMGGGQIGCGQGVSSPPQLALAAGADQAGVHRPDGVDPGQRLHLRQCRRPDQRLHLSFLLALLRIYQKTILLQPVSVLPAPLPPRRRKKPRSPAPGPGKGPEKQKPGLFRRIIRAAKPPGSIFPARDRSLTVTLGSTPPG